MELDKNYLQELEPQIRKLGVVMLFIVSLIFFRLYYLQGIKGSFYRFFSEENSIREIPLPAARGMMWDRNGIPLADNRVAFDLVLVPQYVVDPSQVFETLQKHLKIPLETLRNHWDERLKQPAFQGIILLEDVPQDIVSWVKAHKNPWGILNPEIDLRGVDIRLRYEREYLGEDIASHVLGYVREIDPKRLKDYQKKMPGHYRRGDKVGVSGLEGIWDLEVRGVDGFEQKVVNAVGREINNINLEEELSQKEAVHGKHLNLTLDARLQMKTRDYFNGKAGAAVALDPKTGEVLLFYSAPSFDLNQLVGPNSSDYWKEISTSPRRYLFNRVVQGGYPPGSTYKIVMGTAALHEKVVSPNEKLHCDGGLTFGSRRFGCWRSGGHGAVDFHRSLVASCDVYYYRVGLRLGVDRIARYARAFGLGAPTGIGFSEERSGLIPTSEWKKRVTGQEWHEGETLSISIGQGADLVTPLQAAVMIATIANGGKKITPHLVKSWVDSTTHKENPVVMAEAPQKQEVTLNPEILKQVYKALAGVVQEGEGTAHRLSVLPVSIGGKTGTAQVVSLGKGCREENCEDHAWFVAFGPTENPRIALSVLVEHGGHGSSAAAPLAGELIQTYLSDEKVGE